MKKILIVDDEKRVCDVVKEFLEKVGDFQVSIANNGRDGLEAARNLSPDLILLDIRMPGIDGMEVLKKLKEDFKTTGIPVIMLTAVLEDSVKHECTRLYNESYIEKPVDLVFLRKKIEEAFKMHEGK